MKKGRGYYAVYPLAVCTILFCSFWGSRAVSVFSESQPISREYCILIDPGHGGEDGGATSCTGRLESAYNLEISLRLEDLFHLLGYETKLMRRTDISIYTEGETIAQKKRSDLRQRLQISRETENPILLSIHQNHFSDPKYRGAQVFYPKTAGSADLARQLQHTFALLDPENHRAAKPCTGVYLMDRIDCTGVLIECGFLSNPSEEALLRSKGHQQKLCAVIATTVSSFLSNT